MNYITNQRKIILGINTIPHPLPINLLQTSPSRPLFPLLQNPTTKPKPRQLFRNLKIRQTFKRIQKRLLLRILINKLLIILSPSLPFETEIKMLSCSFAGNLKVETFITIRIFKGDHVILQEKWALFSQCLSTWRAIRIGFSRVSFKTAFKDVCTGVL